MENAAGLLALGYCIFVGALYAVQRRVLYRPAAARPHPADSGVPEMRPVTLTTADGLRLVAWYRPATSPARFTLLYLHGNDSHLGARADKLRPYLDAGYGVLLVSWRGYAGNPGAPTEHGLYADGRAGLDFLTAEGVAPARMVYYGESLGSGVAVHLAVERPPAALVLEAPYSSTVDVARRRYPFVPVGRLMKDRFDSAAKIGRINAPLLVLHGGRDRTIPAALGRRLFAAAEEPKRHRFFPEAGHRDLYDHGAAEAVLEFLAELAPAPGADLARVPA